MPGISAVKGPRNQEQALCVCVDCSFEERVNAPHGASGSYTGQPGKGGRYTMTLQSEGKVVTKLQNMGWSYIQRALRCPDCEKKRRAKGDTSMSTNTPKPPTVTSIRQPTKQQIRLIILALEDAYDDVAKRYKAANTDKTIATELGDGIMPAWVAAQRDMLYGPAGNEEADIIRVEIEKLRTEFSGKLDALAKRLDVCVKAHDKRVG